MRYGGNDFRLADQKVALTGANLSIAVAKFFVQGLATDPQPVDQSSPSKMMMLSVDTSPNTIFWHLEMMQGDVGIRDGCRCFLRRCATTHTLTGCLFAGGSCSRCRWCRGRGRLLRERLSRRGRARMRPPPRRGKPP